jgi:hypothetical protein
MLDKYTSERQSVSGELRALEGQTKFISKLKEPGSKDYLARSSVINGTKKNM